MFSRWGVRGGESATESGYPLRRVDEEVVEARRAETRFSPRVEPKRPASPVRGGLETTNLFITPGYQFQIVDGLLTNFHRPRSTVLVMVSAFAGREAVLSVYEEAIREKYRLFSYGDCMLIL